MKSPAVQAEAVSVAAIMYQNHRLLEKLVELADGSGQTPEVSRLAQLFYVLASRVHEILEQYRRAPSPLLSAETEVVLSLAETTQVIHSWLRYFHTAQIQRCPEALQFVVSSLVRMFVVPAFRCKPEDVAVLVRPQWHYSVKFIDVLGLFASEIELHVLEAEQFMAVANDLDERARISLLITRIWNERRAGESGDFNFSAFGGDAPRFPAILSFSSLDKDDALLYPLLAHEVGHLIDLCHPQGRVHQQGIDSPPHRPAAAGAAAPGQTESDTEKSPRVDVLARESRADEELLSICLAEVAADLIATRMLGPSYFIALAEYFKSKFSLDATILDEESGYPAAQYRLRYVLRELDAVCPDVLQEQPGADRVSRNHTARYLQTWRERLEGIQFTQSSGELESPLQVKRIAESLDQRLAMLRQRLSSVVPEECSYRPSVAVDRLVSALSTGRSLRDPQDGQHVDPAAAAQWLGDVMFAAWIYELSIGEVIEESQESVADGCRTYSAMCSLVSASLHGEETLDRPGSIRVDRATEAPGSFKGRLA